MTLTDGETQNATRQFEEVPRSNSDELVVRTRRVVSEGVIELTLQRPDGSRLPDWSPGAHIDVILPSGTIRQYSLCGDRWDAHSYRVAVQREEFGNGGSKEVHDIAFEGSRIRFGGPRNNFRLAPAHRYAFIAGGIGITAIIPMIEQAQRMSIPWRLIYLGRDENRMAYRNLAEQFPDRVRIHTTSNGPRARIREWFGEHDEGSMVYACGPGSLLESVPTECAPIPSQRIRTERFTNDALGSAPINTDPYEIVLARKDEIVHADGHQSVAEALDSAGINIITSCSRGVCGTCEVAVLAGQIDHRDTILDDEERAAGTCLLPCVSRAAGKRLVLDL